MKYKVGDRVKIVDHRDYLMNTDGNMDHWLGKVMTIKSIQDGFHYDGFEWYKMVEDENEWDNARGSGWDWSDAMIAGLANEAEPWTDEEIEKARGIVAYLADGIVYDGGDIRWFCDDKRGLISVSVYTDSFNVKTVKAGAAKPYGGDLYSSWIGKCVSLCKAMGEPIPDFIMNKNRR